MDLNHLLYLRGSLEDYCERNSLKCKELATGDAHRIWLLSADDIIESRYHTFAFQEENAFQEVGYDIISCDIEIKLHYDSMTIEILNEDDVSAELSMLASFLEDLDHHRSYPRTLDIT